MAEPALTPRGTDRFDPAHQGPTDRPDAGKAQNVAFQAPEAVGPVVQAIDKGVHSRRYDDARRLSAQKPGLRERWPSAMAKPARNVCSKKAFSNAGIAPSQSG